MELATIKAQAEIRHGLKVAQQEVLITDYVHIEQQPLLILM